MSQGHAELPQNSTYEQRIARNQAEYSLRLKTAQKLNETYKSGRINGAELDSCLAPLRDRQNFLETFYYNLFSTNVQRLDRSHSPPVQALMKIFHSKYGAGVPVFRVTGSFGEQNPTPLPAGVQRAINSIYMDFSKIDPDDWLIVFVHEVLHAVDDQIFIGVQGYADTTLIQHFVQLSLQLQSYDQLSKEDSDSLKRWLMFGLDRGLLAEYRAWSATLLIYEVGLIEGLWNHRGWLDQIIVQQKQSESLPYFTYHYLDERSADPTDDLFSNPLIASSLKELRAQLRRSPLPPPLGVLALIFALSPFTLQ